MFDVLIIGAGPAGGMAAKTIANSGYSVAIIEIKKEVGYPVQCAESVSEFCLNTVGIEKDDRWIKNAVKGVKIVAPNGKFFYCTEKRYNVDRHLFDKSLVEKAVDDGAELHTETKAERVERRGDRYIIKTNKGDFEAKIVVAADGPLSNVATQLGMLERKTFGKAVQYKFDAKHVKGIDDKWLYFYMHTYELKGGYIWIFPRGDEYNIGLGGRVSNLVPRLRKFCNEMGIDPEKRKSANGGLLPFEFVFKTRSENNCLVVGDAAGLTNPATGGGIFPALYSGKLAGEIIIKSFEEENPEVLKEYDRKIRKTPFLHPSIIKTAHYYANWKDEDWNRLATAAHGMDMEDMTVLWGIIQGIKKHHWMITRGLEMLTIRKAMLISKRYS